MKCTKKSIGYEIRNEFDQLHCDRGPAYCCASNKIYYLYGNQYDEYNFILKYFLNKTYLGRKLANLLWQEHAILCKDLTQYSRPNAPNKEVICHYKLFFI